MKGKQIGKILVDIGMTIVLLLLMAYELIGQTVHEWLGVGIFVLAVAHHVLNGRPVASSYPGRCSKAAKGWWPQPSSILSCFHRVVLLMLVPGGGECLHLPGRGGKIPWVMGIAGNMAG